MRKIFVVVFAMVLCIAVMSHNGYLSAQTQNAQNAESATTSIPGDAVLAIWSNTAASIHVPINDKLKQTVYAYSNRPSQTDQNGASFYYTRIPVLEIGKDYFDPDLKSINFDIQLLSKEYKTELNAEIVSIYNLEKFQLTPLLLSGYIVRLIAEDESETIALRLKEWAADTIPVSKQIKNEYILDRLVKNPNSVVVEIELYYQFQVIRTVEIAGKVSSSLQDRAIEEVLGGKPKTNDLFVSRNVLQELSQNIETSVSVCFPINPPQYLRDQFEEIKKFFLFREITQEEMKSVKADNLFFLPKQFQLEIEPTIIKNVINSINERETFHQLLEKSWDELHTIATESDSYSKFYSEAQKRIKTGGSGSGSFLSIFSASASVNFEGEWNSKSEKEKRDIEKFCDNVRNVGTFKEELFRQTSKAITGNMNYSEVQAKNFDLHRISLTDLQKRIEVCVSQIEKFPPVDISYSYSSRIQDSRKMPPVVPVGTIVAYWGTSQPEEGWLLCDGRAIPEGVQYDALRAFIEMNTPSIKGKTPDLRGVFLRGLDSGRETDPNRALGSLQGDTIRAHNHTATATVSGNGAHTHYWKGVSEMSGGRNRVWDANTRDNGTMTVQGDGAHTHSVSVSIANAGGAETRPINVAVNYIIKY